MPEIVNEGGEPLAPRSIRCALLDASDIFIRVVELASTKHLTDRHLSEITECDLTPWKYRWDRARRTFVPLGELQQPGPAGVSTEQALYSVIKALEKNNDLGAPARTWAAEFAKSVDALDVK
mgnify:CR=1 FL=1